MDRVRRSTISSCYADNGFCFPEQIISRQEAEHCRALVFDHTDTPRPKDVPGLDRQVAGEPHLSLKPLHDIATSTVLLDIVEQLVGPDILIWTSTLFTKEPLVGRAIPWHQDLRHPEIEPNSYVTAWLALTDATRSNGCLRFIPGSHKLGRRESTYTYDKATSVTRCHFDNLVIDEARSVHAELAAGQASFHDGYTLHASSENRSGGLRLGFAITYISPKAGVLSRDRGTAILARGTDRHGHFIHLPHPKWD